ncbi:MAG: glycosyltransferase [Deltaproteobacteria bacterium]|nr:glycosyltransferase [Deltaproteobacteria bacterium]
MGGDLISVIIPTWNRMWCICDCLDSAIEQRSVDFEIIVVDDGSDDETEAMLPEIIEARKSTMVLDQLFRTEEAERTKKNNRENFDIALKEFMEENRAEIESTLTPESDPVKMKEKVDKVLSEIGKCCWEVLEKDIEETIGVGRGLEDITLIRLPERRGVSAARNVGIKAAKGNLITFLDSDDVWLPGKLEAQAEYMAQNPEIGFSQCLERWMRNGRKVNPGVKHRKKGGDIFIESLGLCLISPSAVIIRKELLDEVGLFDESLMAAEDYDLWLRMLVRHPVGLLEKELVVRNGGRPDQLSATPGLDRYRVMALKKLLAKEKLSPERKRAVLAELINREAIFENGKKKRIKAGRPSDL